MEQVLGSMCEQTMNEQVLRSDIGTSKGGNGRYVTQKSLVRRGQVVLVMCF